MRAIGRAIAPRLRASAPEAEVLVVTSAAQTTSTVALLPQTTTCTHAHTQTHGLAQRLCRHCCRATFHVIVVAPHAS